MARGQLISTLPTAETPPPDSLAAALSLLNLSNNPPDSGGRLQSYRPDMSPQPQMESDLRRIICCLLRSLVGTQAAFAQVCGVLPAPPNGPADLHLSETVTISIHPSLRVADLVAISQSP
jgi:hypothetical protein